MTPGLGVAIVAIVWAGFLFVHWRLTRKDGRS